MQPSVAQVSACSQTSRVPACLPELADMGAVGFLPVAVAHAETCCGTKHHITCRLLVPLSLAALRNEWAM